MSDIDFDIVERTIENRLKQQNLNPEKVDGCINTGYDYFHIHRGEVQVLEFEDTQLYFASVEFKAILKSPLIGDVVILDLVTTQATSVEQVLQQCANYYMDVTFPAIQALFDERFVKKEQILTISSYTQDKGLMIKWKAITGELQILNDPDSKLKEYFKQQYPLALVFDTITGYLSQSRLHWCKVYIGNKKAKGVIIGCSIDGQKSLEAEEEIKEKFHFYNNDDEWECRLFVTIRPDGKPEEKMVKTLQNLTNKEDKKWWEFWK